MINNVRVKDAKEFYIPKSKIDLDIDRELSNAILTQSQSGGIAIYDNYKYNQTFTSMMNSFFIDVIKRIYLAM